MSTALDTWVVKVGSEQHKSVLGPINIAPNEAKEDLSSYHPTDIAYRACNFRLRADPSGEFAVVEIVSPEINWNDKFAAVLKTLQLRVVDAGGPDEHLLDDRVPPSIDNNMVGWSVTRWAIRRTSRDPSGRPLELKDEITWTNAAGAVATSSYLWRPYDLG